MQAQHDVVAQTKDLVGVFPVFISLSVSFTSDFMILHPSLCTIGGDIPLSLLHKSLTYSTHLFVISFTLNIMFPSLFELQLLLLTAFLFFLVISLTLSYISLFLCCFSRYSIFHLLHSTNPR